MGVSPDYRLPSTACSFSRLARDLLEMARHQLGDRYRIEEEIGRGGAARVFRARDRGNTMVALKILRPELLASLTAQRFLREISVLKKLEHPRIAPLLDYGEADWLVWYVMAYVDGPTLRRYLDKHKQAPLHETLKNSCDVLDAVAHAHSRGIVHRDVKPENIMLTPQGAMLLDFGIAKAIAEAEEYKVTRSGFTVGSSAYMSPEQAAGQDIDHRADIYSLGCVLYECLAGRPPFQHANEGQVLMMQQRSEAADVRQYRREVSAPLAKMVSRALAKDPRDRWQSAQEMKAALLANLPEAQPVS